VGTGSFVIGSSNLRVGAGTLRGTARALRVTGSITQTGGFILEMSSTVSLSGSLSIQNDATFAATGTLIFSGNANQTLGVASAATLIAGNITLRNTGSAGSNKIILDCYNISSAACGVGLFAPSSSVTVTTGQLDLATNSNALLLLDGGITVANNALASVSVGNGTLIMSGSLTVGSAGSISFGADASLSFSGTGTISINLNGASAMDSFYVIKQDDIAELNGCPNVTLASNVSADAVVLVGNPCTLNLSSYTLAATGAQFYNLGVINRQTGRLVTAATDFAAADNTYSSALTNVGIGNQIYLSITDPGRNLNYANLETLSVTLTTTEGDSETLTMTEITSNGLFGYAAIYGVFRGSVGTTEEQSVTVGDGIIQLLGNSTTVTISYTDPVDGLSNTTSVTLSRSASTSSTASSGGGGGGSRRTLPGTSSSSSTSSVSSASSSSSSSSKGFNDVPSNAWFASFVHQLMERGIVSGYKDAQGNPLHEFRPTNSVTYAELAKMAAEAAGLSPLTGSSMNTSDDGQWSEGYIALLESREVSVFQNHALDVNTPAPRGAVVQILLETFGITDGGPAGSPTNRYDDVPSSSPYFLAISIATHEGVISGDDGKFTFRPNDPVNRAETAKMVLKTILRWGNE
jgi:hypothetical protein